MKICILGYGKMGSWLAGELAGQHELAVYDVDPRIREKIPGSIRADDQGRVDEFAPELLLNAVDLQSTIDAFRGVLPMLPRDCILGDVASIKGDLPGFYREAGFRFVSVHPMSGPTFANLSQLQEENAVVISDSDPDGKLFFREFFEARGLHLFEYSFDEHDRMMAYSLTLPFVSSMVFSSCVSASSVPGTTFKRHLEVARGLLSEDDFLLAEIIFNPHSLAQLEKITGRLNFLWHIIKSRDTEQARLFFNSLRKNIDQPS
jgi:prephenate dehydrogenase